MTAARLLRAAAAAALFLAPQAAWTVFDPVNDDTDIFLANPGFAATRPNVLIMLDNSANWNTAFATEKAALVSVVNGMTENFNLGFGMFVETGGGNDNVDGAYLRFGIRPMNATNKGALSTTVNALDITGDRSNNAVYSLAMGEIYRYFNGTTSVAGFGKVKRDFSGNTANNPNAASLPGNPLVSAASSTYVSPIIDGCQKNFIIFISNGPASDNSASLAEAQTHLAGLVGQNPPTTITISPSGEQGLWSDEYAKFMANSDCHPLDGVQNVFTYTIDVLPGASGQGPSHTAQLKSMASNGKGKYFPITDISSTAQLEAALNSIFQEVQAVNSVFASTTLPVSVNVRGTNLNQVYIGVFRPDQGKSPRWLGNLKLYKLGVNTSTQTLFLADANGAAAENASTGFITGSATSFWSASSTYWAFRDPELNGVGGSSDAPDGDLVEKGGGAQRIRLDYPSSQSSRSLYTCVNATLDGLCANNALLSATPFTSTHVTAADLGAFTSYAVSSLQSSGTTATLRLGAEPNPAWANGDQIKVEGASPSVFNGAFTLASVENNTAKAIVASTNASPIQVTSIAHGYGTGDRVVITGHTLNTNANATWTITAVDADNFELQGSTGNGIGGASGTVRKLNVTYTFTLPSAPDPDTAEATGANHNLQTGDLITISGAGAFNVTDASVTRLDANKFRYTVTATGSVSGGISATGKKLVTSLSGSGNSATAVVSGHGYATGNTITISGSNETAFNKTATITVVDANSFTYSTSPDVISGTSNTARVTATAHNVSTNQQVRIAGNSVAGYNGQFTVTKLDNNTFTFPSTESLSGADGVVGLAVTNFSHPTTGSAASRDVLTVTTEAVHNIVGPFPFSITITGATGGFAVYNGTWSIASVADVPSATTFRITNGTFDSGSNGNPGAGVVAGKPITTINPIVTATGSIRSGRSVTVSSITALSNATGAIIAGRLADGDNTLRDTIINWVRGADNRDDENPATTPANSDIRPSAHGDVLHSRPAVVNYNRYGDDHDIYAFYGSNDGIFRALKGGTANHSTGPDTAINPGIERWGFIPREFLGRLKRLREQSPAVSALNQKDYFADGSIGVYTEDAGPANGILRLADGDKVYLYLTLRRGGDFMYALDVTDPAAPRLLWRKSPADPGWEQLGQTWSEPKVTRVAATLGAHNPRNVVLIFGAGYHDTLEDINPCLLDESSTSTVIQKAIGAGLVTYTAGGSCTISGATGSPTTLNRTRGRGILVVDAFNGNVVWQASSAVATASTPGARTLNVPGMSCAIPSDVAVLDKNRDVNRFADRVYVGDTCGQVWRLDISSSSMDDWAVTRIANISTGLATDVANKRKFLFPPDLVFAIDATNYTAVLLGTGDREHPFDTNVINRFYMLKDRDSADPLVGATNSTSVRISGYGTPPTGSPYADTDLFDATSVVVDGTAPSAANGWKITLSAGEKVVSSAVTISGTTFFNTNQPSSTAGGGACGSNLGIAREYLVGFADAGATIDVNASGGITIADRSTIHAGGGYLPSPVPVVVEIDGKKYQAVISGTSVQSPPGLTLEKRTRSHWYKQVD
jgi:Tfp pilus tip-associated adhesin PilY1